MQASQSWLSRASLTGLGPCLLGLALGAMACSGGTTVDDAGTDPVDDAGSDDADAGAEPDPEPDAPTTLVVDGCSADDAAEPPCQDEQYQQLFHETPAAGTVTNVESGGVFTSDVDATAGGFGGDEGFIYLRFTDAGLEKVELSDEESLESTAWDIAFRRYLVRLNSGPGGPSCVMGARLPGDPSFDEVEEVAATVEVFEEQYYTDSCEMVPDGTGLETSPATVLSSFWSYPGCVAMSGYVYVVALADARLVKLEVLRYYASGQDDCNDGLGMGSGSAQLQVRWAFLE